LPRRGPVSVGDAVGAPDGFAKKKGISKRKKEKGAPDGVTVTTRPGPFWANCLQQLTVYLCNEPVFVMSLGLGP
jgi:hypothetical protein